MIPAQVYADIGAAFADTAASGPLLLALGAAVLAGLVSFASPCVIPLVPGYISYLAGVVGAESDLTAEGTRFAHTVAASLGRHCSSSPVSPWSSS